MVTVTIKSKGASGKYRTYTRGDTHRDAPKQSSGVIGRRGGTYTDGGKTVIITEGTKSGGAPQAITSVQGVPAREAAPGVLVTDTGELISYQQSRRESPAVAGGYSRESYAALSAGERRELDTFYEKNPTQDVGVKSSHLIISRRGEAGEAIRATTPKQMSAAILARQQEQETERRLRLQEATILAETGRANYQTRTGEYYKMGVTNASIGRASRKNNGMDNINDTPLPIGKIFTKEGIKRYTTEVGRTLISPFVGTYQITKYNKIYPTPFGAVAIPKGETFAEKYRNNYLFITNPDVKNLGLIMATAPVAYVAPTATAVASASIGTYQFYKNPTVEQAATSTLMVAPAAIKGIGKVSTYGKVLFNKTIIPLEKNIVGEISVSARGKLSYTGVGQEVNPPVSPRVVTISRYTEQPKDFILKKIYGSSTTKVVEIGDKTYITRSFGNEYNPKLRYVSKIENGKEIVNVYRNNKLVNIFSKKTENFLKISSANFKEEVTKKIPLRTSTPDKSILVQKIGEERLYSFESTAKNLPSGKILTGSQSRAISFSERAKVNIKQSSVQSTFEGKTINEATTSFEPKTVLSLEESGLQSPIPKQFKNVIVRKTSYKTVPKISVKVNKPVNTFKGTSKVKLQVSEGILKNEFTQSVNKLYSSEETILTDKNIISSSELNTGLIKKPLIQTSGEKTYSAAGTFSYDLEVPSKNKFSTIKQIKLENFDNFAKKIKNIIPKNTGNANIKTVTATEETVSISPIQTLKQPTYSFNIPTKQTSYNTGIVSSSEAILIPKNITNNKSKNISEQSLYISAKPIIKNNIINKPIEQNRIKINNRIEPIIITESKNKYVNRLENRQLNIPSIKEDQIMKIDASTDYIPKVNYANISKLNQVQKTKQIQELNYYPREKFLLRNKIPKNEILYEPTINIKTPFNVKKSSFKKPKSFFRETRYTPSVYAITGKITGKPKFASTFTGLGVRPILKSKRIGVSV